MSVELDSEDEQCFNMYWKIENLSHCWDEIKSPMFICSEIQSWIILNPKIMECRFLVLNRDYILRWKEYVISFLTCDGSPPLHGHKGECLRMSEDILRTRRSAFLPDDTLTIRFRYPTASERGKFFARSRIGVKRESFLLTLKNFNEDRSSIKKCFRTSKRYGTIELNGRIVGGTNSDKQFSIEICRTGGDKCYFVFKVSLLDVDGTPVNEVSDEFIFEMHVNQPKELRIIKISKLLASKTLLLPNDTLSLKCDFSASLGELSEEATVISYFEDVTSLLKECDLLTYFKEGSRSDSITDLQTDLKSILDDGTLSDVAIQVNSEVIQVHKNILIARSPVFRKMFSQDMKESIDGAVVIEDLDVDTVRRLLLYMYTGAISDYQWEDSKKLYFAADKYEVLSLKKKCVSLLNANLSVSNVWEAFVLAHLHQDGDLKTAAFGFISKYGFSLQSWKKFEDHNFSLAHQTLLEICARGQAI